MSAYSGAKAAAEEAAALRIRRATRRDVAALTGLLRELFMTETEFAYDEAKQERGLRLLLGAPSAGVWVAERGGMIVGMVTVQLVVSTAEGGLSGLLEDLVVSAECRNAGIGALLLETAVQWTRAKGATRIQLLADRTNAAAFRFYFRHTWELTRMIALRRGF